MEEIIGFSTFSKGNSPKVNVIMRLVFELTTLLPLKNTSPPKKNKKQFINCIN